MTLALYVQTCDHANSEGLYWLPTAYICGDLRWQPREAGKHLDALVAANYVEYDPDAEVIWVADALQLHSPTSAPQIKGALNALERVPESPLFESLLAAADEHAHQLAKAIRDRFPNRLPKS